MSLPPGHFRTAGEFLYVSTDTFRRMNGLKIYPPEPDVEASGAAPQSSAFGRITGMELNPYQSPQGPPEPRPKPRWALPDVVVLIYGAGIVFGGR